MPSLPLFNQDLPSAVPWESSAAEPPLELPRGQLKDLRGLGHKIERFLAARAACWKQAAKVEGAPAWLRSGEQPPRDLAGEGYFACGLCKHGQGFKLLQPVLTDDLTSRLLALWRRCDPEAPSITGAVLSTPPDANASLWLALLRLRPLRDLWERELRRNTFESLLELLPDAWVLDPAPLPAGAVIPRLELSSWLALPSLRESGRRFLLIRAHDSKASTLLDPASSTETWALATQEALDAFTAEPRVLVEVPRDVDSEALLIAFYEKKEGRVEGIGALALTSNSTGGLVPRRVIAA